MTALRCVDSDEIVLHRLFFALMPSAEVVPEIAAVRGGLGIAKSHVLDHRQSAAPDQRDAGAR